LSTINPLMAINNLFRFAADSKLPIIKRAEENLMPTITVIQFDGKSQAIEAESGKTLMQNVLENMLPGIDADCGGACACGTCHCFIGPDWSETTGAADPMEESMLGMRPDRLDTSRLSCQIEITDDMDGMVVRLPEYQM